MHHPHMQTAEVKKTINGRERPQARNTTERGSLAHRAAGHSEVKSSRLTPERQSKADEPKSSILPKPPEPPTRSTTHTEATADLGKKGNCDKPTANQAGRQAATVKPKGEAGKTPPTQHPQAKVKEARARSDHHCTVKWPKPRPNK